LISVIDIRNVKTKQVQCNEIWSFCYSKEKNVAPEHEGILGHGEVWTWVALDVDSKLAINWLVGTRTVEYAEAFIGDLASRLADRIQLTTDGYEVYIADHVWSMEEIAGLVLEFSSEEARSLQEESFRLITPLNFAIWLAPWLH